MTIYPHASPDEGILKEEHRILYKYGFISYAQIKRKEDLHFLLEDHQKVLWHIVKEFPIVLETYNLSPSKNNMSTFSVIQILEELPSLTWITPEDVS